MASGRIRAVHPRLRLLDVAEVPRVEGWSLRSALVRYAQPEPVRAGRLLQNVRRLEAALAPSRSALERRPDEAPPEVVALLGVAELIDGLADELAAWACDVAEPRPLASVDQTSDRVEAELDRLGAPREARPDGRPQ